MTHMRWLCLWAGLVVALSTGAVVLSVALAEDLGFFFPSLGVYRNAAFGTISTPSRRATSNDTFAVA